MQLQRARELCSCPSASCLLSIFHYFKMLPRSVSDHMHRNKIQYQGVHSKGQGICLNVSLSLANFWTRTGKLDLEIQIGNQLKTTEFFEIKIANSLGNLMKSYLFTCFIEIISINTLSMLTFQLLKLHPVAVLQSKSDKKKLCATQEKFALFSRIFTIKCHVLGTQVIN